MIYCKLCYPKIWHTPLPADPRAIAAKIQEGEDGGGCPRCGGKVSCVASSVIVIQRNVENRDQELSKAASTEEGQIYSKTTQRVTSVPEDLRS